MGIETKRKDSIGMFNLGKGILMLSIMFGHSLNLFFHYWEYAGKFSWKLVLLLFFKSLLYGAVSCFFMMSGYFFTKTGMGKSLKKSVKYLMKPYLIVSLLVIAFSIIKKLILHKNIIEALQYQGIPLLFGICPGNTTWNGILIGTNGPLWFLIALAIALVLLNALFYIQNEMVRVLYLTALIAFITNLPFIALIPFSVVQAVICTGFLYIGYLMKQKGVLLQKLPWYHIVIMSAFVVLTAIWGNSEVSQNVWKLGFIEYAASIAAGILLVKFAVFLNCFKGRFFNLIRTIGNYSLYILCIHSLEYLVIPWEKIAGYLPDHWALRMLIVYILRSILVLLSCYLFVIVLKKMRKCKSKKKRL